MKVIITEPAWESYAQALNFLSGYMTDRELERWDKKLWDNIDDLKKWPRRGQYEPWLEYKGEGHRRLVVGKFKVIYRIGSRAIYIMDIFDAQQDPRKMKG